MTGQITRTAPVALVAVIAATTAGTGAVLGFVLSPWMAVGAAALIAAVLFGGATGALAAGVWLPLALPLAGLVSAVVVTYVIRYLAEERMRRQIQRAFSHYLAPAIVDRLALDPSALQLGGERREITVMFADLSGFTAMSGTVEPEVLNRLTNHYLGLIVEQVE